VNRAEIPLLAALGFAVLVVCRAAPGVAAEARGLPLIPWPTSVTVEGGALRITPSNCVAAEDPALAPLAAILAGDIARVHGMGPTGAGSRAPGKGDIRLRLVKNDPKLSGAEAYRVVIRDDVVVEAASYNAVGFGMMTVLQTLQRDGDGLALPRMTILDSPDRAFRALQCCIKVSYHEPAWVMRAIDLARFYKVRHVMLHTAEAMWIGCTLASSNGVPIETRRRQGLWTKREMDDVIEYARARGVLMFPHNESTPHFPGMKHALTTDFDPADPFAGYMDEVDGKGPYAVKGDIPDSADPRYWHFIKEVTQRAYDQFAAGWPDGQLGYYHMGPVYGEGGTNPANALRILGFLKEKNPAVKLMYWNGPGPGDPVLAPHKANLAVAFYSRTWGGPAPGLLKAGYNLVNVSWTPLYILPKSPLHARRQGKWIFDEFQLCRFGSEGTPDKRTVDDGSPWAGQVIGSMLPTWEMHRDGHLEAIMPCIPYYAEHAWTVRPYFYPKGAWEEISGRFATLEPLMTNLVREPRVSSPPTCVTATQGVQADRIDVLWGEGDNFPQSYDVYRAEVNDPAKASAIARAIPAASVPRVNRFEDRAAKPGVHYHYWVRCLTPYGSSELSKAAEGFTGTGVPVASASESFDYPAGASIPGLNGGEGWAGPWTLKELNGTISVGEEGLAYPGLRTSGRRLCLYPADANEKNEDGSRRRPPHPVLERKLPGSYGADGTEVWLSFLVRARRVGIGDFTVQLGRFGFGKLWGDCMGIHTDRLNVAMAPGRTYLVVVRYTFHRGNDLLALWLDPKPGVQPADADADVLTRGFDNGTTDMLTIRMQPYGLGQYDVDELRIGRTYRQVTPVAATR